VNLCISDPVFVRSVVSTAVLLRILYARMWCCVKEHSTFNVKGQRALLAFWRNVVKHTPCKTPSHLRKPEFLTLYLWVRKWAT